MLLKKGIVTFSVADIMRICGYEWEELAEAFVNADDNALTPVELVICMQSIRFNTRWAVLSFGRAYSLLTAADKTAIGNVLFARFGDFALERDWRV